MKSKLFLAGKALVLASLLIASACLRAGAPGPETELLPADFSLFRNFGTAVAIDGDSAVVGVPRDSAAGSIAGAVYVFVRSGGVWSQQAKLTASDASANSEFGSCVAISGDTLVAGAHVDPTAGFRAGSAYVFVRNGTIWTQQAKLTANDAADEQQFGTSVAIEGDTVAVGAVGDAQNFLDGGAVYVFTRSGATWTQQGKLAASEPLPGNQFGFSVALSNGTLAVGSPFDDDLGVIDAGAVYIFTGSGASWTQQAELTSGDASTDDLLGWSIAMNGDTLIAGAPGNHLAAEFAGSAYVFVRNGAAWSQQGKLVANDTAMFDCFGYSVALSKDVAYIGAALDSSFASNGGSVYTFKRAAASWSQADEFSAAGVADNFNYGYAVSASGTSLLVGVPGGGFLADGAAFVYDATTANTAPVADNQTITTPEGTPVSITLSGSDNEGNALTFAILDMPNNGILTGVPPNLSYTPNAGFTGADSFMFNANDGDLDSAQATVIINVTPVNHPPVADATATATVVISANNVDAAAVLNGSRSSDPDNDSLTYIWFEGANTIGAGVTGTTTLAVGIHHISLVVSDGVLSDHTSVTVRVITASEAINQIISAIQSSDIPSGQKNALIASLDAATASFVRGNMTSGINQLRAFENKAGAQSGKKIDAATVGALIDEAQNIIRIIKGG